MKKISISAFLTALLFVLLLSCEHKAPDAFQFDEICFNVEILPIFQSNCATCHNDNNPESGYSYENYNSIMESIKPGDAEGSKAYQYITEIIHEFMPPERPLSIEQRTKIRLWIEQGAKETYCTVDSNGVIIIDKVCFERDILPIMLSSCGISGCHDAVTHEGDVILTDYNTIINNSEIISPFDPLNSKMYKVLLKTGEDQMPPSAPLTTEQIALIYDWISDGALNEVCAILCDTSVYTFSEAIDNLVINNCKGCHSASAGVSLTNYDQIKAIADDGSFVDVINNTNGKPLMPPSGSLSDCQITQIEKWVLAGALNNK